VFLRPHLSLRTFHLDLLLPSRLVITHRSPSRSVFLGCPSHHHPLLLCISAHFYDSHSTTHTAPTPHDLRPSLEPVPLHIHCTHNSLRNTSILIPQHSLPPANSLTSPLSAVLFLRPRLSLRTSSWLLTQMISVSSRSTTFIALKSHVVTHQYSSRNTLFPSSKQSHICSHTNTNPRQTSKTIRAPRPHSHNSHTKPQIAAINFDQQHTKR
jgi:hypothetical protein